MWSPWWGNLLPKMLLWLIRWQRWLRLWCCWCRLLLLRNVGPLLQGCWWVYLLRVLPIRRGRQRRLPLWSRWQPRLIKWLHTLRYTWRWCCRCSHWWGSYKSMPLEALRNSSWTILCRGWWSERWLNRSLLMCRYPTWPHLWSGSKRTQHSHSLHWWSHSLSPKHFKQLVKQNGAHLDQLPKYGKGKRIF